MITITFLTNVRISREEKKKNLFKSHVLLIKYISNFETEGVDALKKTQMNEGVDALKKKKCGRTRTQVRNIGFARFVRKLETLGSPGPAMNWYRLGNFKTEVHMGLNNSTKI